MNKQYEEQYRILDNNLSEILAELEAQPNVAASFPPDVMTFEDSMAAIRQDIDVGGEYGIAYVSIVGLLKLFPFVVSGAAAIKLLEAGLLLGYKTMQPEDKQFDMRTS